MIGESVKGRREVHKGQARSGVGRGKAPCNEVPPYQKHTRAKDAPWPTRALPHASGSTARPRRAGGELGPAGKPHRFPPLAPLASIPPSISPRHPPSHLPPPHSAKVQGKPSRASGHGSKVEADLVCPGFPLNLTRVPSRARPNVSVARLVPGDV